VNQQSAAHCRELGRTIDQLKKRLQFALSHPTKMKANVEQIESDFQVPEEERRVERVSIAQVPFDGKVFETERENLRKEIQAGQKKCAEYQDRIAVMEKHLQAWDRVRGPPVNPLEHDAEVRLLRVRVEKQAEELEKLTAKVNAEGRIPIGIRQSRSAFSPLMTPATSQRKTAVRLIEKPEPPVTARETNATIAKLNETIALMSVDFALIHDHIVHIVAEKEEIIRNLTRSGGRTGEADVTFDNSRLPPEQAVRRRQGHERKLKRVQSMSPETPRRLHVQIDDSETSPPIHAQRSQAPFGPEPARQREDLSISTAAQESALQDARRACVDAQRQVRALSEAQRHAQETIQHLQETQAQMRTDLTNRLTMNRTLSDRLANAQHRITELEFQQQATREHLTFAPTTFGDSTQTRLDDSNLTIMRLEHEVKTKTNESGAYEKLLGETQRQLSSLTRKTIPRLKDNISSLRKEKNGVIQKVRHIAQLAIPLEEAVGNVRGAAPFFTELHQLGRDIEGMESPSGDV
jgi:hypothetical protein